MIVTCIVAVSENGIIGAKGELPWRLPADLKRFRARTLGKTLVLGRRTYETLKGPLPGRRLVVVTRRLDFDPKDARRAATLDEALQGCAGEEEVMIGGGEEIYRLAIPRADRIDLTMIHASFDGDARFPLESLGEFEFTRDERHLADEKNRWDYSFRLYERHRTR